MIHKLVFSQRRVLLGLLASLVAFGFAIPATAGATVTSVTSCGDIIAPGVYRLDADVRPDHGFACFEITASDVTLHLNGHTIMSTARGHDRYGMLLKNADDDTIVGPGTVSRFRDGILADDAFQASVDGVTVTENDHAGIAIDCSNPRCISFDSIRGNVATGNGYGIAVSQRDQDTMIIGNFAHDNLAFDLFDGNRFCFLNVWEGNDFGTANQPCIH